MYLHLNIHVTPKDVQQYVSSDLSMQLEACKHMTVYLYLQMNACSSGSGACDCIPLPCLKYTIFYSAHQLKKLLKNRALGCWLTAVQEHIALNTLTIVREEIELIPPTNIRASPVLSSVYFSCLCAMHLELITTGARREAGDNWGRHEPGKL